MIEALPDRQSLLSVATWVVTPSYGQAECDSGFLADDEGVFCPARACSSTGVRRLIDDNAPP